MKTISVTWDNQDDYCVAFFKVKEKEYEINIRTCGDIFGVWINSTDVEEIIDEEVQSIFEVNGVLRAIFKIQINLPSIELLKSIEGNIE